MEGLTRQEFEAVLNELTVFRVDCSLSDLRTIVALIIEEWMTYPVEMHTDLVCSSCLKAALDHCDITETLQNPVVRHSVLAIISVREHLEPHSVIWVTPDVTCDGTLVFFQVSPYNRHIATLDGVNEELLGKIQLGLIVLGDNEKS